MQSKNFSEVASEMEMIKTEVLVVGGGGAGLRAAMAAGENGAQVHIVSKTPIGKSTCTYLSAGGFTLSVGGLSKEDHLQATLQSGKGINNREFVKILVEEATERVQELERLGLVGEWGKGRFFVTGKPPCWGAPLTKLLAEAVKKRGVSDLPWITICKIVLQGGRAVGALGYDYRAGKMIAFLTKAIILANGGGAALYQRHDNPVRMTGDGYALAYDAGCSLRDMEFVQFMPPGLAEPGRPTILIAGSLCEVGRVINSSGEEVLRKYQITDRPVIIKARDTFSLAIFREEMQGQHVFLDLRSLSEADWPRDNVTQSQRPYLTKNLSCRDKPIRISPMCHHFMGGVTIDQHGETEIPGLFAAGEVAGGVHGANRLGGNALDEILVFGRRAGLAAAEWAKNHGWLDNVATLLQQEMKTFAGKKLAASIGLPPRKVRQSLAEILWREGGILRNGKALEGALATIRHMQAENLPRAKTETPKEMLEKMESENAFLVAEMILRSALMREESRGAHFRSDFPTMNDQKWKGNIFIKKSGQGMQLEFRVNERGNF